MIYLDYSATTKTDESVLDTFIKASREYLGNPNSLHKLGLESKKLIDASTKQITGILKIKENEIIYTSGATEANNMAIFGTVNKYKNRGKRIISTHLEHSSVLECLNYLKSEGYEIDYVNINKDGTINLNDLEEKITKDTILVTIASVNSEVGIHQNLKEIYTTIKNKNNITLFHSDITQSIGKVNEDLNYVDLASLSAQKFYGIKGIGALIKKNNIEIEPLIKGGKSTTKYRSGTPATALIASLAKALRLAVETLEKDYEHVENLNKYLKIKLQKIKEITINSTSACIPHILNISIQNIKPETILHALEQEEIYISTKTACSTKDTLSLPVYTLTQDEMLAKSSVRISISKYTTKEELDLFTSVLKTKIDSLNQLSKK
ncbi:MAG: cysteine desulfurase [Bacilli bacterium]|nr:cysteine desulfurase [Bacilli bacterium]